MLVDLSKSENEVLEGIRKSKKYKEGNFNEIYLQLNREFSDVISAAKIYILDNYQKVSDYSDLSLILRCANHKGSRYFGKKSKPRMGANTSSVLKNMLSELDKETIQIEKFDKAVYDWSDGDFSVTFNGVGYNWIDSNSIVDIAHYIEEKLKEKPSGNVYVVCRDKFDDEIKDGDMVDVQMAGEHRVYMKGGQLHFSPYGEECMVCEYFSNDLILVKK